MLTKRQQKLLSVLKNQKDYITQETLYYTMSNDYSEVKCSNFHDSLPRHEIARDINAINEDDISPIIVSTPLGIRIADEEEFSKCIKSCYKAVFKKLKHLETLKNKAKTNNQFFINEDDIDLKVVF